MAQNYCSIRLPEGQATPHRPCISTCGCGTRGISAGDQLTWRRGENRHPQISQNITNHNWIRKNKNSQKRHFASISAAPNNQFSPSAAHINQGHPHGLSDGGKKHETTRRIWWMLMSTNDLILRLLFLAHVYCSMKAGSSFDPDQLWSHTFPSLPNLFTSLSSLLSVTGLALMTMLTQIGSVTQRLCRRCCSWGKRKRNQLESRASWMAHKLQPDLDMHADLFENLLQENSDPFSDESSK